MTVSGTLVKVDDFIKVHLTECKKLSYLSYSPIYPTRLIILFISRLYFQKFKKK